MSALRLAFRGHQVDQREIDALLARAEDDLELQVYLYLVLIHGGRAFAPNATDALRAFLIDQGANDGSSALASRMRSMTAKSAERIEDAFEARIASALGDGSVRYEEALALARAAEDDLTRQALLYVMLTERAPAFSPVAADYLRAFLQARDTPALEAMVAGLRRRLGVD